jgi:hypothetical protein
VFSISSWPAEKVARLENPASALAESSRLTWKPGLRRPSIGVEAGWSMTASVTKGRLANSSVVTTTCGGAVSSSPSAWTAAASISASHTRSATGRASSARALTG